MGRVCTWVLVPCEDGSVRALVLSPPGATSGRERAHARLPRPQGCMSRKRLPRVCEVRTLEHQPRGSVRQCTAGSGAEGQEGAPWPGLAPGAWAEGQLGSPGLRGCPVCGGCALWPWKQSCNAPSLTLSVLSAPWLRGLACLGVTSLHPGHPHLDLPLARSTSDRTGRGQQDQGCCGPTGGSGRESPACHLFLGEPAPGVSWGASVSLRAKGAEPSAEEKGAVGVLVLDAVGRVREPSGAPSSGHLTHRRSATSPGGEERHRAGEGAAVSRCPAGRQVPVVSAQLSLGTPRLSHDQP